MSSPSSPSLDVKVYRKQQLCYMSELGEKLEIGRQRPGEAPPPFFDAQQDRLVAAALDDKLVSREHLWIGRDHADTPPPGDPPPVDSGDIKSESAATLAATKICVKNLSKKRSVWVDGYGRLAPLESTTRQLPLLVSFEDFAVRVEQPGGGSEEWELKSLNHPTQAPGGTRALNAVTQIAANSLMAGASQDTQHTTQQLIHWLGETMEVLQSAAGTSDYLSQAVEAVERILGLDTIAALRFDGSTWTVQAQGGRDCDSTGATTPPSRRVLQQVVDLKRTIRQLPVQASPTHSLQGVSALVASPILDVQGQIIGALYGARTNTSVHMPQISELEATMVEVIACSAAAGIAREVQQEKAIAARVQFEQFFTPQLARELESNPQLLDGQDADISVLFCDIVGFSSISGRIGSRLTMQWIGDVMDHLSLAILKHDGVLVDYIGDELMAMWGAPKPQLDHCQLACLAARDLLRCRSEIDSLWETRIGAKTDVRIGIASGGASVGNTGSKRKFKYGPLGETVNLASRLQSAGKHFGAQILVSGETALSAGPHDGLLFRPLGKVGLVNIGRPVATFELVDEPNPSARRLCAGYCELLDYVAQARDAESLALLEDLSQKYPADLPTRLLLERLAAGQPLPPDCLWALGTK